MIIIVHGDDLVASRNFLQDEKSVLKNFFSFDDTLDIEKITSANQGSSLFDEGKKNIIVENFISKNKTNSSSFKEILDYINKEQNNFDIYFWEEKEIPKKTLSLFKNAQIKSFAYPKIIFAFTDSILPGNFRKSIPLFHKSLEHSAVEIIMFMIQRQFRLMLGTIGNDSTNIDEINRLAPWQRGKIEKQANTFGRENLIKCYNKLFEIERGVKTGTLSVSQTAVIDFFLFSI